MAIGELTWGRFRNNLCKTMAYTPRLLQTEVEYCNTFIFDPPTFRGDVQEAAFNDRFLKELVISRTSLLNTIMVFDYPSRIHRHEALCG